MDLEIGWVQGVGDLVLDTTVGRAHLDWVICGGESGPRCRPMREEWAKNIQRQCLAANVPFYFKQWGGHPAPRDRNKAILEGNLYKELPTYKRLPEQMTL